MEHMRMLDLRNFRRWLDEQPDNATVGYVRRADECPLARHILEWHDLHTVSVGDERILADDRDETNTFEYEQQLQPWARRFVRAVDANQREGKAIKAAQARKILAEQQ